MSTKDFDNDTFEMLFWAFSVGQAERELDEVHSRLGELITRYIEDEKGCYRDLFIEDLTGVKDKIFLIRRKIMP